MKPKNIFLVRHGESEGNVNKDSYNIKPDYTLLLTELGHQQAKLAGESLIKKMGLNKKTMFYISPIWRSRQTFEEIYESFSAKDVLWREDPRIREQEWGHLRNKEECERIDNERESFGPFYYRVPDGESCADVYDRVGSFFNTLHRDFEKPEFPDNCVIVTHGISIRCILMRWFHWTVEEFDATHNPLNCEIFQMRLHPNTEKYELLTPLKKREKNNIHVFEWKNPCKNIMMV